MTRLLVLTALEREARGLARALGLARVPSSRWPRFAGDGVEIAPVGFRAGLLAVRWPVADPPPELVVSAGVCGALAPDLVAGGTLVVPLTVLDGAGGALPVDRTAHGRALAAAAAAGCPVTRGPLLTSADVVATPEAKRLLWRDTGAVAVDTESAAIVGLAAARGVASLVVRAVSDAAHERLPAELATAVDGTGRIRVGQAAVRMLRRPSLLPKALALGRSTAQALGMVSTVLAELACPMR